MKNVFLHSACSFCLGHCRGEIASLLVTACDVFPSPIPHYFLPSSLPLFLSPAVDVLIAEEGPSVHRERMGRGQKSERL